MGEPRLTPSGLKVPLSGLGNGFGSSFIGHFWRMAVQDGQLYVGTWDWSVGLQGLSFVEALIQLSTHQYGFDLFRTEDGVHWTAVTQTGFDDPNNWGVRSLQSTPAGLFLASARQKYGMEVWHKPALDPAATVLTAPQHLEAVREDLSGRTVILSWNPFPGAVRYRVYRSLVGPLSELAHRIPPGQSRLTVSVPGPDGVPIAVGRTEAEAGELDHLSFPLPFTQIGIVTNPNYNEPAPTTLQSLYFVRAEDTDGNLSKPSNIVGGPAKALLPSP